jgi:hypothetical protein
MDPVLSFFMNYNSLVMNVFGTGYIVSTISR